MSLTVGLHFFNNINHIWILDDVHESYYSSSLYYHQHQHQHHHHHHHHHHFALLSQFDVKKDMFWCVFYIFVIPTNSDIIWYLGTDAQGANVNARNKDGNSPLMLACSLVVLQWVFLLLRKKNITLEPWSCFSLYEKSFVSIDPFFRFNLSGFEVCVKRVLDWRGIEVIIRVRVHMTLN